MAAFRLLTHAAETAPAVVIADDAHWLDQSSVRVLAFIARRLEHEPIGLVAAVRTGYRTALEEARLPVLDLERLSLGAAGQLVDLRAPKLHPIVRARVLAEAAGNPLPLEELARAMASEAGIGDGLLPGPTTLTARLERALRRGFAELEPETRTLLLALALDGRASMEEVLRSAKAMPTAIDAALDVGVIEVVGREMRFRHPLMRSAVRQAASPHELLTMHAALARAVSDPERRLWHRASSASGCDEEIASELEKHDATALQRGAVTASTAAIERAAVMSSDPSKAAQLRAIGFDPSFAVGFQLGYSVAGGALKVPCPISRSRPANAAATS